VKTKLPNLLILNVPGHIVQVSSPLFI